MKQLTRQWMILVVSLVLALLCMLSLAACGDDSADDPSDEDDTTATYTATFVADDVTVATKTYKTDALTVDAPEVPAKEGYYAAWEPYVLTASDITINAIYTPVDALKFTLSEDNTSYILTEADRELQKVAIPGSYNGLPVTGLGEVVFEVHRNLISIAIPDGITFIGREAFFSCENLTSVMIPSSVTSIGNGVFGRCTNLNSLIVAKENRRYHSDGNCIIETASKKLIAGCKNSIIPTDGSVTTIEAAAFFGCNGLASVTIPDSVISIGKHAFEYCTGLTSIVFTDPTTWYRTNNFTDWQNKTNGTVVDVSDAATAVEYFTPAIALYYWYKK